MLDEYKRKRNFSKTTEPSGRQKSSSLSHIFVIQKHFARRLHYDFRIEHEGVLKSWAVPKGPSSNPGDKRLAVQTEDHPYEYKDFSGTIPEGEYGAGKVEIWDSGKFVNITVKNGRLLPLEQAIKNGHFVIFLKGKKIDGSYAFTRMNEKDWLLVKKNEQKKAVEQNGLLKINGKTIELTNLDKELDDGITKSDLIEYYRRIAKFMLPHVKDRLLSMYRFPDGIEGKKFFQKNTPDYFPDWLPCKQIRHESGTTCYTVIRNEAGILYIANQVIVPHISLSKADKIETPDKLVFDFDPSGNDLKQLKKTVRQTSDLIKEAGFVPFVMTTGGKGYHIAVPVKRELRNEQAREFALKIATVIADSNPGIVTTELRKEKRKGRIFIDVNRISAMQTSVAPYAVRSEKELPIACPFRWEDLPNADPKSFTIKNPPEEDAWKDFFKHSVSIKKQIKQLK